jgi:chromosome segregation ATPase
VTLRSQENGASLSKLREKLAKAHEDLRQKKQRAQELHRDAEWADVAVNSARGVIEEIEHDIAEIEHFAKVRP